MADDGEAPNKPKTQRPQETFHRAQETQVEHKFPNGATGIIQLPPGSRGPKSLYLKRGDRSFGFTLRHFIVYPPDSVAENDGRHAAVGAISTPMDTIFVRRVEPASPAQQAGLQCGDRLVGVNRVAVTGKSYAEVVELIKKSPAYLHLLVVPKEDDILQRYFADTAYNPASNQPQFPEFSNDRQAAQQFLTQTFNNPRELQVDAISWRSLQNSYGYDYLPPGVYARGQRSAENLIDSRNKVAVPELYPNEPNRRQRSRAQPQAPRYKNMGRRASDGCALSDRGFLYDSEDFSGVNSDSDDMVVNNPKMKTMYKANYLSEGQNQDMPALKYSNSGCRLSVDAGRRESSSSLTSSLADGSKDSLSSFDSTATLTGHETDDSAIMSRYRRSFQQKEEFLRMPADAAPAAVHREFYAKPKKLEKQFWPPAEGQDSPTRNTTKPIHQSFQRVKNDIETERDLLSQAQTLGGIPQGLPQQNRVKSPREKHATVSLDRIKEASTAPSSLDYSEQFNGSHNEEDDTFNEDRRAYPVSLQMVYKRAKQFESGKPLPEDDPVLGNRTSFYRSELARISSKRVVPNVTERAQEYEIRSVDPKKDPVIAQYRIQKESRSLESSGSNNSSSSSIVEKLSNHKKLSGNVMISTGSKYIHCPPPSEYGKPTDTSEKPANYLRARSNSAESWEAALHGKKSETGRRISRQDALDDGSKTKDHQAMDVSGQILYGDLPPLIPVPVEHMHFTPSVSITPAPTDIVPQSPNQAVRPTQLDLEGPVRPNRHLKPPTSIVETPIRRPITPVMGEDKPIVVKRRTKNTNLADDDRIMRRESYLKATEGGRMMHFDSSDLSDGDISPRALRSAHRRWRPPMFPGDIQQLRKLFEEGASSFGGSLSGNSSSSASLEIEKSNANFLLEKDKYSTIKEGPLHCKITEIDGKRFGDRSWKQIWTSLKGPKLYLFKDKHHQSPIGSSDAVEPSLSSGVDMRASVVRVAEDYTKRKHVLRVSSVNPCRSEFLLQAENTEELADWVKSLQEQVAATTDVEAKFDSLSGNKQQAVPQTIPASTSIQVQGSRLSPQPLKSKSATYRNRSPTGQSPVSKTRKPSQVSEPASPKSKTWRGRVAKQFRKMQGASSPSSPTAPEGSTFGVPLDQCLTSQTNPYVPAFVEICTDIVDARGLQTVGIYRVPGNNASITAMSEEVNRTYDHVPQDDTRWNDLHVVSSLLKSYFRKIPDSLVTNVLYPSFIKADKHEDPELRMTELRRLIRSLPVHNYHTLKHLILHLKKVVDHSDVNKMEAKNLAIVFGPNIVRTDNMETMVNNMTHQCKIVETLLTCADWFFSENDSDGLPVPAVIPDIQEDPEASSNQALLLDNIGKFEAFRDKEKNGALLSSIISAAQRKVKRKTTKAGGALNESKEEVTSPPGSHPSSPFLLDLKDSTTTDGRTGVIPTTVTDIERNKMPEKVPWFNYSTDQADFHRRIESFEQETKAMLQMPRNVEISVNNIVTKQGNLSSSASNVNQTARLSTKPVDSQLLKTHSASNVFSRTTTTVDNSRHSLINNSSYPVQYTKSSNSSDVGGNLRYSNNQRYEHDTNRNIQSDNSDYLGSNKIPSGDSDVRNGRFTGRRGSSVENIHSSSMDLNANGNMKKIKYENEMEYHQRVGSLDSLHKPAIDDDSDLLTSLTKIYDKKLLEEKKNSEGCLLAVDDLPYADESPEKLSRNITPNSENENVSDLSDSYRNPSLHKSSVKLNKSWEDGKYKESNKDDPEKDEDSTVLAAKNLLEKNGNRHISANKLTLLSANNLNTGSTKLKRSESLNKPERTVSPLNVKLKRSESLNKTGDKLKRLDSLTKTEKTESNLNKRRELTTSGRRSKDVAKLKRKNGMPDRSIKRRHTVGGTKDPDKVTWLDNKYKHQEEPTSNKENKEKNLRTSSPDLSSSRREKLFFEINLIGPEMMALKQHLMGARPQSFPDTAVFNVPLESHV